MPKPKVRKVERKLVPVLEKLSVEELMETNTYQRFNTTIDRIFDNTDDLDFTKDQGSNCGEGEQPEIIEVCLKVPWLEFLFVKPQFCFICRRGRRRPT